LASTEAGAHHVDHAHVAGAQHHRRHRVDRRGDAKAARHVGHRVKAHFVAKLGRNRVLGIGKGGAHVDLAGIVATRIARAPPVDRHRLVHHAVFGTIAAFQRCQIDEQLPRRTGLAHGIGGAVVVRGDVIGAADHRQHRAIAIHADQRALGALGHLRRDRIGRGALRHGIERGPHLDRLVVVGHQHVKLRQHPVGEIAGGVLALLGGEVHAVEIDRRRLRRGQRAGIDHGFQHHLGAVHGGLGIGRGGIVRRRLDQAGDDRRLAQRKLLARMAEELARGQIHAIGAAAEVDLVEIEFEIWSLENLLSRASDRIASRILRSNVRLLLRKMLRASCCVMVEPPWRQRPLCARTITERMMPTGSTPQCSRNRRSSTETSASFIGCGMRL
jgi:hypothetical protein